MLISTAQKIKYLNRMGSLVHAVSDDLGYAFFPKLYINQFLKQKSLKILGSKDGFWNYQVSLTCHNHSKDDSLVQLFANSFKEICTNEIV